jgi:hypothetical protein
MIQANFTVQPLTGDVFATKFAVTSLTPKTNLKRLVWSFGTDELFYNVDNFNYTYNFPGTFNITLTAIDYDNNQSTKTIQVTAELPYRDYVTFTQIPDSFADPGKPTKNPFKINVLSTNIDRPIFIDLFAVNSKSTPDEFIPNKWKFLSPTWKFLDKNLSTISTLSVVPQPVYKNNVVVAVSGAAEFYYVDSIGTGEPIGSCNPILITATLQTSAYSNPRDSNIYNYNSYTNNETVRAGIIWLVNDTYPNLLKITANYINEIYPKQWEGIKIPIVITCHSNKAFTLPGGEDLESEPIFAYPTTNEIGSKAPIEITLTDLLSTDYTIDNSPLYFQAFDRNGNRTGGYLFTTLTVLTTALSTSIVAKTTAFSEFEETDIQKFSYPYGYTPLPIAWVSNPQNNTLNKITLIPYPNTCTTIQSYRNTKNLLDGFIKEIKTPSLETQETINYQMSGFSGIYGLAIDPRHNDVIACDAELDRLYRISNSGEILKTFELSALGDFDSHQKMFEAWSWKTVSPDLSSTNYAFYGPSIISSNPANYIVSVDNYIKTTDSLEIDIYSKTIRLVRPLYEVIALSALGVPEFDYPPFEYPPENVNVDVIQIFNPTLPAKYFSTLYSWTTAISQPIQSIQLLPNTELEKEYNTSYSSLCSSSTNYIVSINGTIQEPSTYTINTETSSIQFLETVPPNSPINIIFSPYLNCADYQIKIYNTASNIFSFEYLPKFVNDSKSIFLIFINGVLQQQKSFNVDFNNKLITFNNEIPANASVSVTQYSLPDKAYTPVAYTPTHISIDRDYNIWVSLFNTVSVLKFDEHFNLLHSAIPNNIEWLKRAWTVLPNDIGYQSAQFEIESRSENLTSENVDFYTNEFFLKPPVVETDKENNCWVTYANPLCSILVKYNSTGQVLTQIPLPNYTIPVNLAITPNNNIWVANYHGSSYTYTSLSGSLQLYDTTTSTLLSTITGFSRPSYLTIDRNGNLWFTHSLRRLGYLNTTTSELSLWTLEPIKGFTQYIIPSAITLSGLEVYDTFENTEDEELGGLAIDVYNRVWVIDSLYNLAWVISATPTFLNHPTRVFEIKPNTDIGYQLDLENNFTYTVSGNYRSAQATGDWTGNKWYQKYVQSPQQLSAVMLSGVSNNFDVLEFKNSASFRRKNESFNTAQYYKSLALPEKLQANSNLFDNFFGAAVGTGMLSSNEDIGQTVYEKIANFDFNHNDIETCNVKQLLSYAEETSTPIQDYNIFLPVEIRNLIDVLSVSKTRLWGVEDKVPILEQSIGAIYNTETDYVTAGTKIILKNKFDKTLGLIPVPVNENESYIYPLSTIKLYGLPEPIFINYLFYRYEPSYTNDIIENIIDWDSQYTILDRTLSSYNDWYGEDGLIETNFRYILTKNLIFGELPPEQVQLPTVPPTLPEPPAPEPPITPEPPIPEPTTPEPPATPTLVFVGNLTPFNTIAGTSSNSQTVVLSGTNLEANVLINVFQQNIDLNLPVAYEISTDGINYFESLTLTPIDLFLTPTTIYIRLKDTINAGSYNNLLVATSNTIERTLPITGTVNPIIIPPALNIIGTLESFNTIEGLPSSSQTIAVSGTNLEESVFVSTSNSYEISIDGLTYFDSLILQPVFQTLSLTTIFIRLKSTLSPNNYTETLIFTSGTIEQIINITGTVTPAPTPVLSIIGTTSNFETLETDASNSQTIAISGVNLLQNVTISVPNGYEISTNNIVYLDILTLNINNQALPLTNIFVRLKANLPPGNYSGNLTATSESIITTILLNGIVNAIPVTPSLYNELGTYYTNYNNTGKDIYVSTGYPISAILDKTSYVNISPELDIKITASMLSALDKWGLVLEGNTFNARLESDTIFNGDDFVTNPLSGQINTSVVIYVSSFFADSGDLGNVLGYAGISAKRRALEVQTTQFNIPFRGFMAFNLAYLENDVNRITAGGKNTFYYTALHEVGHVLGIGTNWYDNTGTLLLQGLIVGAGDNRPNPLNLGLSANFFYTLQTDASRANTDIGKPTTLDGITRYIGDADYIFAFNNNSLVGPVSKAVSAYNILFNTNLTAIPVENGSSSPRFGSIGSHWDEGVASGTWGTDNRNYYSNTTPGAPGLNDELMTPLSEGVYDTPLSKITAGALEDLGYSVNYNYTDTYLPREFNIYLRDVNSPLDIGFNGNTYRVPGGSFTMNTGKPITLKRGLTYNFNLFTGSSHPIYIVTNEGDIGAPPGTHVTEGVAGDGTGSGTLIWNIPNNLTSGFYYLQNGNHSSASALLFVF